MPHASAPGGLEQPQEGRRFRTEPVDALLFVLSAAVVLCAALLSPGDEAVSFLGREIPAVCAWRNLFGVGCPGCGLTRSFVYMAHAAPVEAFRMHPLGPPMFSLLASQIPWRGWKLWRALRRGRWL